MPNGKKNTPFSTDQFSLCPDCDLLLEKISPTATHTVSCPRCLHRLHRGGDTDPVKQTLVLATTALLLYLPAIFYPLMRINMLGVESESSIFTSTLSMFIQARSLVGGIVLLTGLVYPLLILSLLFCVTIGFKRGWKASWMPFFLRWQQQLSEWAMTDIYLIGVFITIIKMNDTVRVQFEVGFFCFLGLVISSVAAQASVDRPFFWQKLEKNKHERDIPIFIGAKTGKEAGLLLCHICHKIVPLVQDAEGKKCPRCGKVLQLRKKNSIDRSWALIVTAILFST
ncbi:MAG: hypothetical protein D3923_15220, partial [Candidatus Electrothrix sp. AR3]|nr:hypothetical protein [Candidatus Electrothrix sp. AR3]